MKLQAGFIAYQDFLGFWTVDVRQLSRSQRSAPQKRHEAQVRRHTRLYTQKTEWLGQGR